MGDALDRLRAATEEEILALSVLEQIKGYFRHEGGHLVHVKGHTRKHNPKARFQDKSPSAQRAHAMSDTDLESEYNQYFGDHPNTPQHIAVMVERAHRSNSGNYSPSKDAYKHPDQMDAPDPFDQFRHPKGRGAESTEDEIHNGGYYERELRAIAEQSPSPARRAAARRELERRAGGDMSGMPVPYGQSVAEKMRAKQPKPAFGR